MLIRCYSIITKKAHDEQQHSIQFLRVNFCFLRSARPLRCRGGGTKFRLVSWLTKKSRQLRQEGGCFAPKKVDLSNDVNDEKMSFYGFQDGDHHNPD